MFVRGGVGECWRFHAYLESTEAYTQVVFCLLRGAEKDAVTQTGARVFRRGPSMLWLDLVDHGSPLVAGLRRPRTAVIFFCLPKKQNKTVCCSPPPPQTIELSATQRLLKDKGVKCSKKDLASYLDARGITFVDRGTKRGGSGGDKPPPKKRKQKRCARESSGAQGQAL